MVYVEKILRQIAKELSDLRNSQEISFVLKSHIKVSEALELGAALYVFARIRSIPEALGLLSFLITKPGPLAKLVVHN